jgi:hypothetical protein
MFEIRNYHYEPTKFDKYQTWATKEAVPYLREHLDSMEARNQGHATVFKSQGWKDIWANHPDANGYLQMEAKFAEEA